VSAASLAGQARPAADEAVLAESLSCPDRFGELYSRYFAEIYRYLAGRLGPDAADDLAADTFLAAFGRRATFDPARGTVRPWLYGIATNLVAGHRRAESRRYAALARLGADQAVPDEEERIAERVAAWRARRSLAGALARLADADRDVLLLVALAGLSYAETGFALSIPEGTVASRLNRESEVNGHPPPADDWFEAMPEVDASTAVTVVDYVRHTWLVTEESSVSPPLTPSYIEQGIALGDFRIAGRTQGSGQPAIELTWSSSPGQGARQTVTVWVDAHSYLPFREKQTLAGTTLSDGTKAQGYVQYSTFEFLPPTVANQARLRVSVLAGYTRVAGPHAPGRTG
jgi:RNA polymerase sigma-70 factor (ECF subfamily)